MTTAGDERRADMRDFTTQLGKLTDAIVSFGERMAGLEQWAKTATEDIGEHDKALRSDALKIANLDNRVNQVFAVGTLVMSLFVVVFSLIAANIIEKFNQLAGLLK